MELLLSLGADIDGAGFHDAHLTKPLSAALSRGHSAACKAGNLKAVENLIEKGANPDFGEAYPWDKSGTCANRLVGAIRGGKVDVVRALVVKHKVAIDSALRLGDLAQVAIQGTWEIFQILLEADISQYQKNYLLVAAAVGGNTDFVRKMVDFGADVNFFSESLGTRRDCPHFCSIARAFRGCPVLAGARLGCRLLRNRK